MQLERKCTLATKAICLGIAFWFLLCSTVPISAQTRYPVTAFHLVLEEEEVLELRGIFEAFAAATSMTFIDWGAAFHTRSGHSISFFIVRPSTDHTHFDATDIDNRLNFNIVFFGPPDDVTFIAHSDLLTSMLKIKWPARLVKLDTKY
jgi:hypothetical protein